MAYNNPTVDDFKQYFTRDFVYGATPETVTDADISNAFGVAAFNFNQDLFPNQPGYTLGYLLLSAHFLVINRQTASQGASGQYQWMPGSKSVGSISESYNIPPRIMDNPEFAYLCKTNYGSLYLQLILPQLSGQIFSVKGSTLP